MKTAAAGALVNVACNGDDPSPVAEVDTRVASADAVALGLYPCAACSWVARPGASADFITSHSGGILTPS